MSEVTPDEVKKIAVLSKIDLEGDELAELTHDFNQILSFVQTISEVDTSKVKPVDPAGASDTSGEQKPAQAHLSIQSTREMAPHFEAGYFVVPRVIESHA